MFEREGYAVFPNVLTPAEVERAADALDEVFDREHDVATERRWVTDAHRVSYALPAKHPYFLFLAAHPGLCALAASVVGPDCVIAAFNGFSMTPGGTAQRLHRDHPHLTPPHTMYVHLVVALDDFTEENGATRVVPASHRHDIATDRHGFSVDDLEAGAIPLPTPAGGVVAYDGALVHAGSANRTARPRRALHVFYGRPWLRPHWDFPASVATDVAATLTAEQRRLLGYDDRPPWFDPQDGRVVHP